MALIRMPSSSSQRRALPRSGRARPAPAARPTAPTSTARIEAQLSPRGEPVLGLYLHIAYHRVMATFGRKVGRGEITPAIIGLIAMLAECPGVNQAALARLMGLERATVGTTVARAMAAGLVERQDAHGDARSYALSLSPRGERMLRALRRRIAAHEAVAGAHLTTEERRALRALLHKLIYG
jgi:DNA-binding MarR family transcriptional regulator